jgi:diacylglycerol O-acyltransferase
MEDVERLHLVTRAMEELTASQQATAFSALMGLADLSPPSVNAAVARLAAKQDFVNVVISYMRGPRRPIYLAGARHVVTYPLLPLAERLALFIGAVDIAGDIGIGLTGDARAVGDLELLREDMLDTWDALRSAVLGAGAARGRATPAVR